ncbi:MAG: hypothetical protein CMP36_01210 [Rickettsiales bacterium]|nr:hypothetical protein [Rickettsiales bacterium]OUV82492.1 MAG: hypothetical protein CBC91_01630 [Rickettsiales bacterium TMED131]|tara:strand:- start:2556 stop:3398 length:843 start_codon:yes stop_codon:yes gene_type:complete
MNDTKTNIIKVYGKNIDSFFQNIITNNIESLNNDNSIYTAILSPQGKYLHDFIMIKENNFFLIEANDNKISSLIKEIKKYDIRNEIKIEEQKDLITSVIIKENLHDNYLEKINEKKKFKDKDYLFFIDPRSESFLYRFWFNKNFNHNNELNFSTEKNVETKRISLSIPNTNKDLIYNKSFILNYNFENINAISFDKGCYIGQENTARQKYRGSQKYSLKTIKIIEGNLPNSNHDLFIKNMKIGTIKSSSNDLCLCLLRTSNEIKKNEKFKTDTGLTFKAL